jgi:hypothetical protein
MEISILQMKKCEALSKTGCEKKVWSSCKDVFMKLIYHWHKGVQLFGDVEM